MARPEHDHERNIIAPLYGSCGFAVFATSARNKPVGITPGIPDLLIRATNLGIAFEHEVKVGTYRQSQEQYTYMLAAEQSGVPYILGDVTSANDFLCWLGIATALGDTIRFEPRERWQFRVNDTLRIADGDLAYAWALTPLHQRHMEHWGYREPTGPIKKPRRHTGGS